MGLLKPIFGIYMSNSYFRNGKITFNGYDITKYAKKGLNESDIEWWNITKDLEYWGLETDENEIYITTDGRTLENLITGGV